MSIPEGMFRDSDDVYNGPGWVNHTYWYEIARDGQQVTVGISKDGTTFVPAGSFTMPSETGATQHIAITQAQYNPAGSYTDWDWITVHGSGSENQPPVVSGITVPANPVGMGTTISATASFTDAGDSGTHTAVWNWGDGTTTPGTAAGDSVSGEHAYASAGIYGVTVTVTDGDGAASTARASDPVVVYDPAGGSVTGGGSIDSPAGAWISDSAKTGKMSFGFVSQYQKGAAAPGGQTQIAFNAADFSFHSTSYDWLVVTGAKAQYRGSGTLNGDGDYAFVLTAVDGRAVGTGSLDLLRIRIWDKGTGTVMYDNEMGAGVTADPTTALGGGSIVVHRESNGKYEDVNGNGRKDFADIMLYFNQMASNTENGPFYASDFDYNGNGRIDFADAVRLFNNL